MKNCDIFGKVIKIGDILSSPSWGYGTTMKVVKIDGSFISLVPAYRGRKVSTVLCDNGVWRVVSR